MDYYRNFCLERIKDVEESLLEVGSLLEVEDDDHINAQQALKCLATLSANANLAAMTLGVMAAGKVYSIGQTYQTIDAVDREDYALDADGVAAAVATGDDAAFLNYNPAPIGVGRAFSHPLYPRVLSLVPIKNVHRLGPPGLFNGCLFRSSGQMLFSCRTKGIPSQTFIYNPIEDPLFEDAKELKLPTAFQGDSFEDVRMFSHRGSTLVSGGVARRTGSGWLCRMTLGELNESRELVWAEAMPSPVKALVEKNWVFFSQDGRLFCVYYPAPHVVYEVKLHERKPSLGERWEAENWKAGDLMENARGGAPPVRVGDEFYHFYHSQHVHGRNVTYQVSLYTFATQPPWNLRRVVRGPLLSVVPSKREQDIIFVVGAYKDKERWQLSCGIQDHETMAISLDFQDVERLLKPV